MPLEGFARKLAASVSGRLSIAAAAEAGVGLS